MPSFTSSNNTKTLSMIFLIKFKGFSKIPFINSNFSLNQSPILVIKPEIASMTGFMSSFALSMIG
jgi:hypothetical protein